MSTIEDDLAWERRFDSRVLGFHHPEDVRYDLQHTRRIERLIKGFSKVNGDKVLPGSDAAGILDAVWGRISAVVEAEEVQMPEEVPQWAGLEGDMTEWDGWTVSLVRECIVPIASVVEANPEVLIEAAKRTAHLNVIGAKSDAERVESDLKRRVGSASCPTRGPGRKSPDTKLTFPASCTRPYTNSRRARPEERGAPRLLYGWILRGYRTAKIAEHTLIGIISQSRGMKMSFEVVAQKPRELRVDWALSLRALGERNGVTYDTINKLQLGQRPARLSTIRKLAEVLEVQTRELMN